MALPKGVVEQFEQITRFDFQSFLISYVQFMGSHRRRVFDYYSGRDARPNEPSFRALSKLLKDVGTLNDLIDIHGNRLKSGAFWELTEMVSDMYSSLLTVENSSKWLRSAITKNNFNPTVETTYILKKLQTLERVSGEVLGSNNRDQDWVRIALRNDLTEEGYNTEGGNELQVTGTSALTIKLFSVVDNISGKKVYGLDLDRKLTFENDDLKVLSYEDTINQTVEILSNLKQGMTPEFPSNGIQGSLINGTNLRSVSYPVLIRQIFRTFQQDDTLKALAVTEMRTEQDALFITIQVETRLGEVIEQTVNTSA